MVVIAIYLGHMLLHGSWPIWPEGGWSIGAVWELAPSLLKSWALGSVIVGLVMAALTFILAIVFFRFVLPRQRIPETAEAD